MTIAVDSGFQALLGYRIVEWSKGLAVAELAVGPQHLNRNGFLHGGVLTALIDTVCGYAGCYCAVPGRVRRAMTLSLTTNFTAQVDGGVARNRPWSTRSATGSTLTPVTVGRRPDRRIAGWHQSASSGPSISLSSGTVVRVTRGTPANGTRIRFRHRKPSGAGFAEQGQGRRIS